MSQHDKTELCATIAEAAGTILDATAKFRAYSGMEPPSSWWKAYDRCVDKLREVGEYIAADELLKLQKAKTR